MSVNVRVPYFASQWVAKRLIAAGQPGAIVNTASVAGQRGSAVVEYGASKAAIINLTRSLGTRLGRHGIRVNAIAPGLINTAMGARVQAAAKDGAKASALGRSGEPAEIASVVDFLVGDAASIITRAMIDVNGDLIVILAPRMAPTTLATEVAMQPRIDTTRISPGAYKSMRGLQSYVDATSLEPSLRELVNIRASQINACTFCLHMHLRDARKAGESQERLDLIGARREAPVFSERERAALAWTEAVTLVADTHVPDDIYDKARAAFSEQELVDLTMAAVTINAWNRLMVSFRIPPAVAKNV